MKKILCLLYTVLAITAVNAQYKEPNDTDSIIRIRNVFPRQPFDSIAAKDALAPGTATIKGVLFSKAKGIEVSEDFKTIFLFPATPYFKEWYDLKIKGDKYKKGIIKKVAMDSAAFRYKYWCESNVQGKFTFPNLKPGKYILCVTVGRSSTRKYNVYQGSSYDNYGGQTDYYTEGSYSTPYTKDLLKEVEIPQNGTIVNVKWKE